MDALADVSPCSRHIGQRLLSRMRDQRRRRLGAAKAWQGVDHVPLSQRRHHSRVGENRGLQVLNGFIVGEPKRLLPIARSATSPAAAFRCITAPLIGTTQGRCRQSGTTTATKYAQEMRLTTKVPRNTRMSDVMRTSIDSACGTKQELGHMRPEVGQDHRDRLLSEVEQAEWHIPRTPLKRLVRACTNGAAPPRAWRGTAGVACCRGEPLALTPRHRCFRLRRLRNGDNDSRAQLRRSSC
jgi:hypothetical protein